MPTLLTIEEMVYVTQPLVTPGSPVRAALERVPGLSALMPHITMAYNGLLIALDQGRVQSMAELSRALDEVDDTHDALARAVYYSLEANLSLARANDDDRSVRVLEQLSSFLFPHDLRIVDLSYREEADQAERLSSSLGAQHRSYLEHIPVRDGSLLDLVEEWLAAGVKLGQLARERESVDVPGRRLHVNKARAQWLRAIHAVRTIVELTDTRDPLIDEALGRIAAAEIAAYPRNFPTRAGDGSSLDNAPHPTRRSRDEHHLE